MSDDPYPLKPGFAYHLARARRGGGEQAGWEAFCKACGWVGPAGRSKDGAEEDAYAHDVTHNI